MEGHITNLLVHIFESGQHLRANSQRYVEYFPWMCVVPRIYTPTSVILYDRVRVATVQYL